MNRFELDFSEGIGLVFNVAFAVFVLSLGAVAYSYVGYPACLRLVAPLRRRWVLPDGDPRVPVTVVVAVHNGARSIEAKLEQLLDQDYRGPVEIIVADDASTDGTAEIVRGACAGRVRLVRLEARGGKEQAQRAAIEAASGAILVFTDVRTGLDRDALRQIVRPFGDPAVGSVSSEDAIRGDGKGSSGESFYVRYEMATRRLESEIGSLVGLSGSFFAVRREICTDFSPALPSDFRTALVTVRQGYRAVVAPEARGYYEDVSAGKDSWNRKVRTIIRGLTTLFAERDLLNPFRYGFFAWQLASHKLARWTVPFALIALLASNIVLALSSRVFVPVLTLQFVAWAWAVAIVGFGMPATTRLGKLMRYIAEGNLSAFVAWMRYLTGTRVVMWSPTTHDAPAAIRARAGR